MVNNCLAELAVFRKVEQVGHLSIMSSISLFISGRNNDCLARFLQLSIPKCLWWIKDFISAWRVVGTTIR